MHLSQIEMLEIEKAVRAVRLSYSPDDALPILVAITEMVADGELTSGADVVAALEVFLEDDDDEA
jgi:hypothetical protein